MAKYKLPIISGVLLVVFITFTILICTVDVQTIGPEASKVGFATFNEWFHNKTGVNFELYKFTDYLSLITIPVGATFAILGVVQWIKRKSIMKVDSSILSLGIFYVLVFACYLLFQIVVVNYRPVLIEGELEASFPSSTTMLSLTLFITAIDQVAIYIEDKLLKDTLIVVGLCLCLFLVIGRILSGVHWATDIIGGVLLSAALIFTYFSIKMFFNIKDTQKSE